MDRTAVFGELAKHSLDLAIYVWPVSFVVLAMFSVALLFNGQLGRAMINRRAAVICATYAFPMLVLLVGAVLSYDWVAHPSWVEPPAWRGWALWAVVILHVAVLSFLTYSASGARWRFAALLLPGLWLSLSCAFVAVIDIAGVGP
jgi:hypothetical protein